MDKDFENKVKQKRIRTIAVALVVVAAVIWLIAGTTIEKADYTRPLEKQIRTAEQIYNDNLDAAGNGIDQYAPYTLLKFEKDMQVAREVLEDASSEYGDKKKAYENLKAQTDAFKKEKNNPVLTEDEMSSLIAKKEAKTVEAELESGQKVVYTIDGSRMEKATDVNLMARVEGPYYEVINAQLAEEKLQGQVISFYQDGSFCGKIKAEVPFYSEGARGGYVYQFDCEKGEMTFVSDGEIDGDGQTVAFSVENGGDYVILTEKIHQEAEENDAAEMEDVDEEDESDDDGADEDEGERNVSIETEEPASDQKDQEDQEETEVKEAEKQPATQQESESDTITVSLDIRCDTLSADLSKLRDPSLEAYVPADGIILSLAEVEVTKGESVYDVLNRVCRDKSIHMEAVYTPNYGADYIEGINYLYEFDAGEQSGWMYTVNSVFPNYGCSDYILEDGDRIVWAYTCDMGKDLGKKL